MIVYRRGTEDKCDIAIKFVLFGLLVTPIFVREMYLSSFYQMNFFAFWGCLIIVYTALRSDSSLYLKSYVPVVVGVLLFLILALSELHAGRTFKGFVRVAIGLIIPLTLLYYKPKFPKRSIHMIVICLNIVSALIVLVGLFDFAMDHSVLGAYFTIVGDDNYYNMLFGSTSTNRLFSFWGHPLYNAEIFLISFGLNYREYEKKSVKV